MLCCGFFLSVVSNFGAETHLWQIGSFILCKAEDHPAPQDCSNSKRDSSIPEFSILPSHRASRSRALALQCRLIVGAQLMPGSELSSHQHRGVQHVKVY